MSNRNSFDVKVPRAEWRLDVLCLLLIVLSGVFWCEFWDGLLERNTAAHTRERSESERFRAMPKRRADADSASVTTTIDRQELADPVERETEFTDRLLTEAGNPQIARGK